MKQFLFSIGTIFIFFSCQSGQGVDQTQTLADDMKEVVVKEVLQASSYTYLLVKEGNEEKWFALPKMEAEVGKIYYYQKAIVMQNFSSRDLNRNFEEVYFLENIYDTPEVTQEKLTTKGSALGIEKKDLVIESIEGAITLEELFSNKTSYAGKTVKVVGQVAKFSPGIMERNWIHIQDGTSFEEDFDLTVTSDQQVAVGDTVTVEGIITLDKDFGAGYFYKVIMESAIIIHQTG